MKERSRFNVNHKKVAVHRKVNWRSTLVQSMRERSHSSQIKPGFTKTTLMVRNLILINCRNTPHRKRLIWVDKLLVINLKTHLGLFHQINRTNLLTMHGYLLSLPRTLRKTNQPLLSNPYSGAAIKIQMNGVTIRNRFKSSRKYANKY